MTMRSMYECIGKPADGLQQMLFLLGGYTSKRFSSVATLKENSLAAHQHGVAMLCYLLAPEPSVDLLMAALVHDLPEQVWGDLPSPVKRRLGIADVLNDHEEQMLVDNGFNFPELTDEERYILKLADKMEVLLFAIVERRLGNRYMEMVYLREREGLLKLPLYHSHAEQWANILDQLWKESTGEQRISHKA